MSVGLKSVDLGEFIAELPKAELHVHHVGSASPRTVAGLAERHAGSTPVPADPDALAEYFTFTDFAHFIDVYLTVVDLIRTPDDVFTLTYEVARDLAAQQVRYAELTVTPYTTIRNGIAGRGVLPGDRGRPRCRRNATSVSNCAGASTSPASPDSPPPRSRWRRRWSSARPAWSVSDSVAPNSAWTGRQFKPYFDQARAAGSAQRAARG